MGPSSPLFLPLFFIHRQLQLPSLYLSRPSRHFQTFSKPNLNLNTIKMTGGKSGGRPLAPRTHNPDPQRPVSHSLSVVSTVSREKATTLSVSVLVLQSTWLPSLNTLRLKSSNLLATPLVTTRRPVSSPVIFSSPSATTRS